MKLRRLFSRAVCAFILLVCAACPGSNNNPDSLSQNQQKINSAFFFSSNRTLPGNEEGDGDLFYAFADGSGNPSNIVNLSDAGDTPGDADDHLCLLDITRMRLYFMSQRTDIDNPDGDMDIFGVSIFGGQIVNLTEHADLPEVTNPLAGTSLPITEDDFCNAIEESSGDLIFTSTRNFNGSNDPDIYRMQIMTGFDGSLIPLTLTNLTELNGDNAANIGFHERFELLIGTKLFYTSRRSDIDSNGISNMSGDSHIFEIDITDPDAKNNFINLSQEGDDLAVPSVSTEDRFCGVVPQRDPVTGAVSVLRLVFESDQSVGDNSGAQFSQDSDIFVMDPDQPNVIYNLTDGATADSSDACRRVMSRVLPLPGVTLDLDQDFVVLFESDRNAHGTRDANGIWSLAQNANGDNDIFFTTLPLSTPGNTLAILSDGDPAQVSSPGPGTDGNDILVGICGTTVIFDSDRGDLEDNPAADHDLFGVDVGNGEISSILPITNGRTSTDDRFECFLGCEANLGGFFFASPRLDEGNLHGPADDSDIFRVRLVDSNGERINRDDLVLENLTDAETGDGYDILGAGQVTASTCDYTADYLEGDSPAFVSNSSGFFFGYYQPFRVDDFASGLNINNTLLFTSERESPVNVGDDVDIFSVSVPPSDGGSVSPMIVNLTDSVGNSADDMNDGLEGYRAPFFPPGN